jgi:hypothetical protein
VDPGTSSQEEQQFARGMWVVGWFGDVDFDVVEFRDLACGTCAGGRRSVCTAVLLYGSSSQLLSLAMSSIVDLRPSWHLGQRRCRRGLHSARLDRSRAPGLQDRCRTWSYDEIDKGEVLIYVVETGRSQIAEVWFLACETTPRASSGCFAGHGVT